MLAGCSDALCAICYQLKRYEKIAREKPMAPRKVMLVRHAEKIGDPTREDLGGLNLSPKGLARAAALPALFLPPAHAIGCAVDVANQTVQTSFQSTDQAGLSQRFETPNFIIATKDTHHSARPRNTASFTAAALGCPFDSSTYSNKPDGVSALAADLLTQQKFHGLVVLVFWHHGTIPDIATALGSASPPAWPGDEVFDRVWTITFSAAIALSDDPQHLLFGDS
jgi:hypothetical protein